MAVVFLVLLSLVYSENNLFIFFEALGITSQQDLKSILLREIWIRIALKDNRGILIHFINLIVSFCRLHHYTGHYVVKSIFFRIASDSFKCLRNILILSWNWFHWFKLQYLTVLPIVYVRQTMQYIIFKMCLLTNLFNQKYHLKYNLFQCWLNCFSLVWSFRNYTDLIHTM